MERKPDNSLEQLEAMEKAKRLVDRLEVVIGELLDALKLKVDCGTDEPKPLPNSSAPVSNPPKP